MADREEATVPTDGGGDNDDPTMATLSTDELDSWTLLDSSPRRSPNPVPMEEKNKKKDKDQPSRVEDEEEEVSEAESASEEEEPEEDQQEELKEEVEEKTSRVEVVHQEKSGSARDTATVKEDDDAGQQQKKSKKSRKKRTGSERSVDSHDDEDLSSDGISVISESSDAEPHRRKVHLAKGIPALPEVDLSKQTQLSRKRRISGEVSDDESKELVRADSLVPWSQVGRTSVVLVGMVVTALVAILVGNSRTFNNRVDEYKFQHEQRISELELENNILKNEMNKLKHLYTRTELDEQVQQADVEWEKVLEEKLAEEEQVQEQAQEAEPEPTAEPESPTEEPLVFRKVPPQDEDIKRRVVWSGDDGQPMLIADKDYVLPDFCFNKNAVQDDLFSEYSSKYCDIKKRKVEAKLRKAEFARKNHKRYKEPRKDYTEYIIPTQEEIEEYHMKSQLPPPKPPSLSPFEFDYKKAFETIKEEGAVIVDSLVAILDLDPEPEYFPTPTPSTSSVSDGSTQETSTSYQADDEASSSPTSTSSSDTIPEEIRWESYPPWVREKYANQPEMHGKLRNKERLLWDWERKKNEFLHEVGLETLEEVDRKSEDELRLRREEYRSKNQGQSGEWRQKEGAPYNERKYDGRKEDFRGERKQYDQRRGSKEQRYEERKEWKDRGARGSGENRSREHQNNGNQQPWKNDSDENRMKSAEYSGESSKEWKNSKESREASGGGKPYHKKEWKNSEERRDGKPYYKKDSSKESSSGDGGKPYYKKDWKDGSGEQRDGKPYHKKQWKQDNSGERHHSGENHHGKRKDFSDERKDDNRGGPKRNGDQWNWSKDDSGEDHSGEEQGSYLSEYRRSGEDHHHKKDGRKFEGKRKFHDDDDDDDDDDDHRKKHHNSKEDHHRKHHKDGDHWKQDKKHHDGDRKWQEHSQERRR